VDLAAGLSFIEPAEPEMILLTRVSLVISVAWVLEDCQVLELIKLDKHLGDKTAKAFEKQLGIRTVAELLEHYPRRYSKRGELTPISSMPLGENVTVVGQVLGSKMRNIKGRAGSILEVLLSDGKDEVTLAFFNQAWRQKDLHAGVRGLFSGKLGSFSGKLQLAHPDYELFEEIDPEQAKAWSELPIPIYPASSALTTWKIQKSIALVLEALPEISERLPEELLETEGLIRFDQALRQIHQPKVEHEWQQARDSLRFHEAMLLQLQLAKRRAENSSQVATKRSPNELVGAFDKSLPFDYTKGQHEVNRAIEADMASGSVMHRLLQGEVGAGKTIVALRAMLIAADSQGQSALLAPTEVLAAQHYRSVVQSLGPDLSKQLGVSLLTGQLPAAQKKKVQLDIVSGKCKIAIGTHALIADRVEFADLAMIVVDEQHRFGVNQRDALRAKGKSIPHVLTMTATPIPRTMAITVFGDLEISTLTELPAGRKPISSFVVPVGQPALVSRVWSRVAEEVAKGRQAFVVCPRIDGAEVEEDSDIELEEQLTPPAAATEVFEALKLNPALAGLKIGLLHGRMGQDEKELVMQDFSAGEISVLVSTTVIEVGVNVPNATAMVILDADRFGISQLHQLRGRVGRGEHSGICLLVSAAEPGTLAMQRLEAVASTNDGFKLSEIDLELRGEGDVLGQVQSGGKSQLKLLRVIRDSALIERTKSIAEDIFQSGLSAEVQAWLNMKDAQALSRS
jgi:ATP-dependent DNA helicase RecG